MKLNKKIIAMTLVISCLGANMITAKAADGGTYNSNAAITFEASTDVTLPVDPENPGNPITPVDPTNPITPGTAGPLSIDFASSFYFGTQVISSQDKTYYAMAQIVTLADSVTTATRPNYVQVTDNRGTEAGWTLTVKQNGYFISTADATHDLAGATITINNINVNTASASAVPSTVASSILLNTSNKTVMAATDGEGAGTYIAKYGNTSTAASSVVLNVPGSITKYAETYKTTLTWTLTDTPGNN
jgi:hypothetical protein